MVANAQSEVTEAERGAIGGGEVFAGAQEEKIAEPGKIQEIGVTG